MKNNLPLHEKLESTKQNAESCMQYLSMLGKFSTEHSDWKKLLEPIQEKLTSFMIARNTTTSSLESLVQYAIPFMVSTDRFFRSEYLQENVPLTLKETEELVKEVTEAVHDPKDRENFELYAATLGFYIREILIKIVDMEEIEKKVEERLDGLRFGLSNAMLGDLIARNTEPIVKGSLLANKLEEADFLIFEDNTYEATSPDGEKLLNLITEASPEVTDMPELNCVKTPLVKLLHSFTAKKTL